MKKYYIISMFFCMMVWTAKAQVQTLQFGQDILGDKPHYHVNANGDTLKRCGSHAYLQNMQKRGKAPTDEQFERWVKKRIEEQKILSLNKNFVDNDQVILIPVVVHVIHNGEAVGVGRNISDAQVNSQITVLNQDFRKTVGTRGHNTHPAGVDCKIEFVLAKRTPAGAASNGINRVNINTAGFTAPPHTTAYVDATIKPATIWDAARYMNMWSVDVSGGVLGYAQFPTYSGLLGLGAAVGGADCSLGVANTDGVVMGHLWFGSKDYVPLTYLIEGQNNAERWQQKLIKK